MVENTFTTEFATASALVSAAAGVAVDVLVLAASASAVAARTATDGTARLATKSSVLRGLRPGKLKFICLQDNGIRAGKPSPFFKLLAMRLHSVVRIMSDESRGWKPPVPMQVPNCALVMTRSQNPPEIVPVLSLFMRVVLLS